MPIWLRADDKYRLPLNVSHVRYLHLAMDYHDNKLWHRVLARTIDGEDTRVGEYPADELDPKQALMDKVRADTTPATGPVIWLDSNDDKIIMVNAGHILRMEIYSRDPKSWYLGAIMTDGKHVELTRGGAEEPIVRALRQMLVETATTTLDVH